MSLPPPSLDLSSPPLDDLSLTKSSSSDAASPPQYVLSFSRTGNSPPADELPRAIWYLLWPVLAPTSTPSEGDFAISVHTSDASLLTALEKAVEVGEGGVVKRSSFFARFGDFALSPSVRVLRSEELDAQTTTTHTPPHTPVTHPTRPPQSSLPARPQHLYSRWIPHLDRYLCLSIYPPPSDEDGLKRLNGWLNDERVDRFWQDRGSLEEHRTWLESRYADDRVVPVLGSFKDARGEDEEPFGYFEMYWAPEDKIARVYEARPYDRGLHMLVGSSSHRGPHRVQAWLPSLTHYLFLADERTGRVVSEPDARNEKMWRYLEGVGFESVGERDMGHKVARIMVLEREGFYKRCPF